MHHGQANFHYRSLRSHDLAWIVKNQRIESRDSASASHIRRISELWTTSVVSGDSAKILPVARDALTEATDLLGGASELTATDWHGGQITHCGYEPSRWRVAEF
jgi:hypothetical protein